MRTQHSFLHDTLFLEKALQYAAGVDTALYLNPNDYAYPQVAFLHALAIGTYREHKETPSGNFEALKGFLSAQQDWAFGYFSYDLKNELEVSSGSKTDTLGFPLLHFFVPMHLILFGEKETTILSKEDPIEVFHQIQAIELSKYSTTSVSIVPSITQEQYIQKVNELKQAIVKGNIYETNFCMEYHSTNASVNPLRLYKDLNEKSPMPFSCFLKHEDKYLVCASPERFIKKENNTIFSQPIKGTAKRTPDQQADKALCEQLKHSPKERAENIMIVDLVRNDLSKTAKAGSVKVTELCEVYSFPMVHQMISTVTSEIAQGVNPVDVIKQAFPMGSMTGAPKVKAMELIEALENTKRGLFSGAVGYFTPELDFDFNVVIRSILYNATNKYLSFQVGSAITANAEAEKEFEECMVKTAAIRKVLGG